MALQINRTMRLPGGEFFPTREPKSGICLHHTVGGSARSTFDWWMRDRTANGNELKVGTAYIIDRDGTVFEVFNPDGWAYQFGLKWPVARKLEFEKRFIGIEIASEGALIENQGKLYCFDTISPRTEKRREEIFDCGANWRTYRYFDRYEPAQVDAVVQLVNKLCDDFGITRDVPDDFREFYGDRLKDFKGVIGHSMVRADKSDPAPDPGFWNRVINECGLNGHGIAAEEANGRLTDQDIEELFRHNAETLNKMNVAAGAVVSALLAELERAGRKTYLRLRNPAPRGHTVDYELVKGDRRLINRIGQLLGFKSITENRLEVHGG